MSVRIKVFMQQPVVPSYRLPLFEALAAIPDFDLRIQASPRVAGLPDSVPNTPDWVDVKHPCRTMAGGRWFWQRGLHLPDGFGPGDVFVFNGNPRFLSNVPLFLHALLNGVGTLWWGHGWSSTSVAWRARIRYALMRLATVTLLYTDAEVDAVRALGFVKGTVLGLNNTIDTGPSRRASEGWTAQQLSEFRRRNGLEGSRVLLFCGRLRSIPPTELEVALRALAEMRKADHSWRLVIIGTGEEEGRLRALQRELGLGEAVVWKGAIYDEDALAPWFLSASCLVAPGAIGLSLLHAFSYGLPVVTHAERRLHGPEIAALRDGENGLLFERGNASALAARVSAVCGDPAAQQKMSAEALETVMTTFSFDSMVGRFAEAIRLTSRNSSDVARTR